MKTDAELLRDIVEATDEFLRMERTYKRPMNEVEKRALQAGRLRCLTLITEYQTRALVEQPKPSAPHI